AGRAELAGRNHVSGEWRTGCRVAGHGWSTAVDRISTAVFCQKRIFRRSSPRRHPRLRQIGEIAAKLRCGRDPRLAHLAAALAVPLFRPEEEELVLLDRPAYGVAEVVAAQIVLLSANRIASDAVLFLLAEEKVSG